MRDRDADRAEAFDAEIGGSALRCGDVVTDDEAIVAAALERLGRIDVLVNNVGSAQRATGKRKLPDEEFERVFAVNFTGARRMIRAALKPMRAAGSGSIVNISSLASIAGANMIAYEVSKAALNRLTTATAQGSAGKGVRCNAVLPGLMDTPMGVSTTAQRDARHIGEQRAVRNAMVPLKGGMAAAGHRQRRAVLASDEARFVPGVLLPVDGGMSVRTADERDFRHRRNSRLGRASACSPDGGLSCVLATGIAMRSGYVPLPSTSRR